MSKTDAVEKITGLKITERESEYLFKMIDANKDGLIDTENELVLYTPEKDFKRFFENTNEKVPFKNMCEEADEEITINNQ